MVTVGRTVRVGGSGGGLDNKDSGPKGRHENTAKVARRRANAKAEKELAPEIKPHQTDHRIPTRDLAEDLVDAELVHIGDLIAGVQDFKVLRGSIAVLSLATSIEFAHLLTDASMISRGNVLVARLYQVARDDIFDEPEDEDDGN